MLNDTFEARYDRLTLALIDSRTDSEFVTELVSFVHISRTVADGMPAPTPRRCGQY